MKKADVTYSNRPRRRNASPKRVKKQTRVIPRWVPYGTTALLTVLICVTINFRAFTEKNREIEQNESLNSEIEKITDENLGLQEEIYYLQNDSSTIQREAKKFGFQRKDKEKQVPVPTGR